MLEKGKNYMVYNLTIIDLVNILICTIGLGVCTLCLFQISFASEIRKDLKKFFQLFFIFLIIYIFCHLTREINVGTSGDFVHYLLYVVTFIELSTACLMAHMISVLILYAGYEAKPKKSLFMILGMLLILHFIFLISCQVFGKIYYIDSSNEYHRGSLYILSNICPVLMLLLDSVVLVKKRNNYEPRLRRAFWYYIIWPVAAAVIQSAFYGLQLIIFTTFAAAVFTFIVVMNIQSERVQNQKLENSRIETELNLATKIQKNMLPSLFPAFPERDEFTLFATMTPAKEVGGDFYDFFLVDGDHLGLVVADVSGKGVPAAMFMMYSKNIIANNVMLGKSPAVALLDSNALICSNNSENMFLTAWLGILELSTGKLVYADAGHERMAVFRNGYWGLMDKKYSGIALGMFSNSDIEMLPEKRHIVNQKIVLKPGDVLFQYTDGVTEAANKSEELFGESRLLGACAGTPSNDPNELLPHIQSKLDEFVQNAPQFDDITMLSVRYNGTKNL